MNIQEPALDWPSVTESWTGIKGESGSNPYPGEDQPSDSPFPTEARSSSRQHILIVEDNPADVFVIRAAIKAANIDAEIHVVKDGEKAIAFFDEADGENAAPRPALILLDINLPRKQGGEVLQHLRKSRRCGDALVIVVSSSDSARDREDMASLGANGYFHKPSEYAEFMKLGDLVRQLLNG